MKEYSKAPLKLKPNCYQSHRRPLQSLVDNVLDPCLKCGARLIRTGGTLSISCPEGRVVHARICRACADSLRVSGDGGALAALVANADAHERENARGMKEAA
jgi:hypothetical protein